MAGLGWQELLIVLVIIMVIFGAGKLPQVARSLGQGIKEFKTEANASDPIAVSADGAESDDRSRSVDSRQLRPDQV